MMNESSITPDEFQAALTGHGLQLADIWTALETCLLRHRLEVLAMPQHPPARVERIVDAFDQSVLLRAEWRDDRQALLGSLQLQSDGAFMLEFEVLAPLPGKPLFVESISAWGRQGAIKADLNTMAALGE